MNNFTLTADTPFYQSINYDHDARRAELATEQAYRDVWLYDRDDEARKRVEANTNAAMYALPSMQDKKGMALWGREHARMVAPHLADTPVELAQNMRDRLVDAGMKERYTAKMQELEASGQDSADDWYSLYAGMYRDVEQKAWDDARAREAAVADSLDRLGAYISGADLTPDEEEGKGFSQKDVDNVRSVLPSAKMAALDEMRAFARTYLSGLEKLEDGEQMIRGLKQLEDELHEIVGMDQEKAEMMYNVVMDWAQRVADSDKVSVGDEFMLSVENTWRQFSDAAELANKRYTAGGYRVTGAAGGGPMMVEVNADEQARAAEWLTENKKKALARGVLSAGAQKAREIGKNTGWWKSVMRTGAAMAGDTSMYLIPVAGQYLGTISTLAGGQDTYEQLQAGGKSNFAASVQAGVGTGVQAGVELLPFGKIGGKGLSAFLRAVAGESVAKGTSGALAKWVVRHTQKSTMRALAAEAGAGMVEEALVEPLVGGVLSLGLEEAVYALGAPQGEQSRKWTEHFAELSSMLTDPQQLAGLAIFTAALTGASTPAIRRNVKYFERSRTMWEAAGLKPEQVEEVLVSKTPMQTGREFLEQEEAQDAAGLWERRAKANEQILAEGKVLFMTGQSEAEMEAPELAQAYAAAWQEGVNAGVLPEVSANEDGTFTVRERGKAGKEDKVLVLTPAAADAYLQAAIEREEKAQFEQLKQELGEQGAREKAPNLRAMVQIGVAEIAGEAMRRQVAKHGRFDVADVEKQLPEHLAKLVRMRGGIDRMLAARISDWARGRVAALIEGGMSERDAWASKDYAAGAVRSLGDWTGFAESFVHRTEKLANRDSVVTQVFRAQNNDVALVDGATVLGSTIFNVRGKGRAFGWLEDTTESVVDQLIQARGAKIYEAKQGEGMTREEAERQALNELGEQVARARAAVLKADPSVKVFEVKKDDRMSVIEAFSDISNSAFLTSGVVPKWMRPMAEMMKANVVAANTALTLAKAWEAAIEADPEAVQDMRKVLDEVGIDVRDIVEETNISAEDIETWKMARAEARAVAYGPRGVGGEAVSEVVQQAEAEEAAIRAKEAPVSEERKKEVQAEVRAQEEHVERVFRGGAMSKAEERRRDLTLENVQVSQEDALMHLAALEGKPLQNEQSGFVAVVNKPQRKELTNIGKALVSESNGYSVDAHYAAVVRIEKLFRYAIACGEYPDLKHRESTVHIHRFACPMMIDGEKAVAWFTAKQTTNVEGSERLYNLELTDIEKLAGTLEYLASHRLDTALPSASEDIVAQIEEAFKTYFEDVEEVSGGIGAAPEEVRGVFVGESCVYNAAGGFYMGLIDKSKLRDGIEQVKVGAKGKHGVIAGRELVGAFQASAAPLYVWMRKNGELWLISGRHRFELLLRDNGVSSHACYVFVEDAEHDEKWARMMDYENNMRDDQADEVTAAMYVRETGYGDAELRKRGLLRNESRSKRGALIGRWAREELWTRFVNGAVKPMDAEIICNLTKNLRDTSRVEEIQRRCCMLLDEGKGWEYIGAMVQLMANKESVFLKQGLLDLGADFEADLARAAAWIEKNLRKLNEAISLVKQGRKLSGKKREEAERLGIATQMEGGEDLLADLEGLRAKFEMVGSYPDLVAQAQLYDGKTEVDPVGQLLEQQRAQREREQGLKELDAEAYLRAKQAEAVPTLSFSVGTETYTTRVLSKAYGTDSNGNKLSADTFITTPMGNVDWYRFPQDEKTQKLLAKHGVKNLPIRLRVGKQSNQHHRGFGLIHMLSHFDEYAKIGETPLLHLYNTLSNLVKIRGGAGGRYQFKGEYERGSDSLLIAQLIEDEGFYSIVSSYPTQMNRIPRRGELVIGRVLFQFPSNSKKAQIPVGKSENDAVSTSVSTSDQASQEKIAQAAQKVNIYDLQIRNANGEVIFQQGVEPKVTFSLTPEMESIKADAVAAGTFMKAPNGKATNLTERQWLQVRTKAFKEWFGDWERTAELTFKVKSITQKEADAELQKLAHVPLLNDGRYGVPAEVNREQREKLLSNNARRKSEANGFSKDEHFFLASKIQKLYKHAVCLGDYRDVNGARDVLAIRRFAAPFVVNGKRGYALLTVKITEQNYRQRGGVIVSNNEARAYSIELDELRGIDSQLQRLESLRMEKMVGFKKQFEPRGTVENVDIQDSPSPSSGEILEVFNAKVKEYFDNVSKVVDENGEPRVVYHGSPYYGFTVFDKARRGGRDKGDFGRGFYFTPNRGYAATYGVEGYWNAEGDDSKVYACFLNIREPMQVQARQAENMERWRFEDAEGVMVYTDRFYDLAWNDVKNLSEIVVFDSSQVKSATQNRGTFDGSEADITMSVVGEHAANWDELKERAFRGRDDGKLRVELDASGAKLKGGKHGQDAKVLAPRFRSLVEFIREKINANRRWNAVVTDWKDNVPSIDSWEEVSFVRRVLEKAGITYQDLGALVNSGILLAVLEPKEEHIGAFLDKVERVDSLSGFDRLGDVLDFPELYKAYPQLRNVPVLWKKEAKNRGLTGLSQATGDVWITVRDGEDAEHTLSTLLHETQHVIQFIEGFAVGGAGSFADMRAWMSDNGYLDQSLLLTNAELYRRLAGEIEARNVQKRAGWDANVRQHYIPFNDTLEYAGQSIVIKASDLGYDNISLSLTVEAQNALHLLEKRRDEVEAQVILEDMQKACERLSVVLAADDDPQVGNGLQVYAEMQALISATRKALPGKYLRQGNLNGLLAWAGVYARMAQNGAMPKRGAIKGEIYDRFVTELGKKNERMQLQGMSEEEAREVMMGLGSTRLEEAFLKVGRDCAKRLDAFLKDRALERIEYLHELVYPKREPGQAWTRGKMDTTAYLLVEKVRAIIAGSRERRAKLEEELREKRREMRRVREAMESGQLEEELGARKLTVMRGQMELMELNAMAEAAAKHAKTLEQLDQELAELDQDAEDYAQREREINEEVALLKTFGNWYYKDAGEAVRAARVFEDIILRGKADWEDKLKLERERRAWLKAQIASHFTTADPDVENVRADDRAAFKGTMGSKAKAMAKGVMSFGHMLVYLRKKLGREFCDDQRAKLARIHDGFMGFNRALDGWMYRTLRDITGLDTKEAQEVWLTQMEEVHDTGIMVTNSRREKIVLSYAEAKRWLGLNKKAFEQERARMLAEAAQAKRKPMNVPTAEVMDELRELYLAYEADHRGVDEDKKQFHLTHEETWEEELRTTKGVLLFFLLTFEQPDYEHLLEANGMSGATMDQIRRYIGPKMVRWGYAMRDKLNEHGQLVAEVFERYTGIPFGARESYFKGVFDTGAMKERDERAAIEQGSAGAGTRTKYGSLIPRRYHKARVERVSATQVFVQAMQQQNNYVQTAEFVREWRGLLSDKDFAKRMEAELGADTMQMLRGCIETLEGAAAGDAAAARAATGVISKMLSGYAVTRLAGNVYSTIKQVSAILNAMAGGYVPEKMVEHGVLVQDMALRKVGFGEFLRSLARVLTLRGAIGKSEVAGQEYIRGRKLYEGKGLAHTAMLEANQKVAGYEPAGGWLGWTAVPNAIWSWLGQKSEKVKELGMEALGFMDAEMCTLSAMALADAVYRQGKAEDREGLVPDELLRARALQLAGMALDIAAQPQVRTQKGYWAASGAFGALAPTLYMFRSDTLSKVGLWGAQMASGEKLPAATSFLAFGVLNALVLALLRMMRGDLPDDDDEVQEMAVEFALNVLTNDASALPLVGETIGTLRNTLQGKHWAAPGGLGEMVLPFVTLGTDIYREVRNIDKDAPLDKHWATVGRLLRSLGASAAIFHESTTGPLANASSIAAAAAVAGNMSMVVKGLIKAMEDAED